MIRQFEPSKRAVEIIFRSKEYGSGYRIGGKLVLTAAHLLPDEGSECSVRKKDSFGEVTAKVVWKAEKLDIGLVELPETIDPLEGVVFGELPNDQAGERLDAQMYGFPRWGRRILEDGSVAEGRQIPCHIYLAERSSGLLVLEARRLPPEVVSDPKSQWQGISGAAVVYDGLVIAVQMEHQNSNRPASLAAVPIWEIADDLQWHQLLEQHGTNPEPELVKLSSLPSNWVTHSLLQVAGGALGTGLALGILRASLAPVLSKTPLIEFQSYSWEGIWLGGVLTAGIILVELIQNSVQRAFPFTGILGGCIGFGLAHFSQAMNYPAASGRGIRIKKE